MSKLNKFLISVGLVLAMILVTGSVQAGTVVNKFLVGGGVKQTMYSTGGHDAIPLTVLGAGAGTNTDGLLGDLVPDETYVLYQHGRAGVRNESGQIVDHTTLDEFTVKGVYYFTKDTLGMSESLKRVTPFLLLEGSVNNFNPDSLPNNTNFSGNLGLGCGYKIKKDFGAWLAGTVNLGADIETKLGAGLYFNR